MLLAEGSLIQKVEENYRALLSLCDHLEQIADKLPDAIDRQECLILSRALGPMISRIQNFEEETIFTTLGNWETLQPDIWDTIDRLKIEHQLDSCYAEDIQDMLRGLGEGRSGLSPDASGFMLRGFFEALRRHVAFEQQLLVPLLVLLTGKHHTPHARAS